MKTSRVQGFTLIELLVVVAIIALLIAILIPALGRAKALAVQGACASSMSSVGKGIILYQNSYDGKYPASYQYVGALYNTPVGNGTGDLSGPGVPGSTQAGTVITIRSGKTNGYIHWSYFLYNNNLVVPTTQFVQSGASTGTQSNSSTGDHSTANTVDHLTSPYSGSNPKAFVCGSFPDQGGLPPTNPFADQAATGQVTSYGGANVTPGSSAGFVDYQAPRVAFTLNEAVCPRNKFAYNMASDGVQPCASRFVKDTEVGSPQTVILGTEFTWNFKIPSGAAGGAGDGFCKSHRPVNGFINVSHGASSFVNLTQYYPPGAATKSTWRGVAVSDLWDNPGQANAAGSDNSFLALQNIPDANVGTWFSDQNAGTAGGGDATDAGLSLTRLDWVGRNHPGNKTNFLYCDGHVESKTKEQTCAAAGFNTVGGTGGGEWGERPYSLNGY